MAYIYIITNLINGKQYVGKTLFSVERRWKEHKQDYLRKRNEKRPLYNAMEKYGVKNFRIDTLEECTAEDSSEREQYWIQYYNTFHEGYNVTLGGDGKKRLNYKQILHDYDTTQLSARAIAEKNNCSVDSIKNIVAQYRTDPNWKDRCAYEHRINNLGISGKSVVCIELNKIFPSATSAANWLIQEGRIKSQSYGRSTIPKVCRGEAKTVGGFHWRYL